MLIRSNRKYSGNEQACFKSQLIKHSTYYQWTELKHTSDKKNHLKVSMFTIFMLLSLNWKGKKNGKKKFLEELQGNKKEVILIPLAETPTAFLAIHFCGVNAHIAALLCPGPGNEKGNQS